MTPAEPPHTVRREPSRLVRGTGFTYDHEVQIALPASYDRDTATTYPVLWMTDGSLLFDLAIGIALSCKAEMIIVGVGCPSDLPSPEFGRRRTFDFSPNSRITYDGLGGRLLDELDRDRERYPAGGAQSYLELLVDGLRPQLSSEYRMDEHNHCLFGVSGGGMFVGYALFARPSAFATYICGSPCLNGGNFEIFDMEEGYAAVHDDLAAQVFLGVGEQELHNLRHAAWDIVGSVARMAQTLRLREYPSLQLEFRVFPGEDHNSVIPLVMSHGIRAF